MLWDVSAKHCNVREDAGSGEMLNCEQNEIFWLIYAMGWRSYTMMAALQEASMKDCIGHASMLSAAEFACGASFLNLFIWKRERESQLLSLQTPGTCTIHTLKLWWAAQKYNKRTKAMVCGARVEPFSHMSTTALLSQWKRIFLRCQENLGGLSGNIAP